jgi:hypothetical protein
MTILITLTVIIIAQCLHISSHHVVHCQGSHVVYLHKIHIEAWYPVSWPSQVVSPLRGGVQWKVTG